MLRKAVDVHAVAGFQQVHAAGRAGIESANPLVAVGHQRLGQVAEAEVLGLQLFSAGPRRGGPLFFPGRRVRNAASVHDI